MKTKWITIWAVLATMLLMTTATYATVYNVRNAPYNAYGDGVHDDCAAIQSAVNAAIAAGPGNSVYLPSGTYLIAPSGLNEGILIYGANGLTMYGDPTTEILNGGNAGGTDDIVVKASTNVTVTSLKLDLQTLRSTQGTVTALSPNGLTITVNLDPGFQSLSAPMFSNISLSNTCDAWFWTDPNSQSFSWSEGGPGDIYSQPVLVSGSTWQATLTTPVSTDVIGKQVGLLMEGGNWGIGIYSNTGPVTISNITDYGGGGSGAFIGSDSNLGPVTITGCTIGVPPGSGRLFSGAGGVDYQGNRGTLTISNCDISGTKDDLLDCGTDLAHILSNPTGSSPTTQIVVDNTEMYYPGDTVQIWDWTTNYQTVRQTAVVSSAVLNTSTNSWALTLTTPVTIVKTGPDPGEPADSSDGIDHICDINDAPPVYFENNRVQTSGRCLNFKCANSVISGNYFYQIYWCVNAGADVSFHGGPSPQNLTIDNNTFSQCDWNPIDVGISYATSGCDNIDIEDNHFDNGGGHPAQADGQFYPLCNVRGGGIRCTSTKGLTIRNNSFTGEWGPSIAVQNSSNALIQNNVMLNNGEHTWSDSTNYFSYGVNMDMGSVIWLDNASNVTLTNNTVAPLGPYNTYPITVTPTCSGITGQTTGVNVGGLSLSTTGASTRTEWFKADAITGLADNAAVTSWSDSSGNGNNAVSGGSPPTYVTGALNGHSVVHFNAGSSQYLYFPRSISGDFTMSFVYRSTQGANSGTLFWQGAGLINADVPGTGNDFGTCLFSNGTIAGGTGNPDVSALSATGYNDGNPHVVTLTRVQSTGLINLFVDGLYVGTTNGGTQALTAPSRIVIGAQQEIGDFFTGDIGEVQVFSSALSDPDRYAVESTMEGRWGIGISDAAQSSQQEWYAADLISGASNGSSVTTWLDNSGNEHNAVSAGSAPTYTSIAINGLPVVHFNSANSQYLSLPRNVQDDMTISCVFRSTQGLNTGNLFWQGAGLVNAEVSGVTNDFGTCLFANGAIAAGTGAPDVSADSGEAGAWYNDGNPHVLTFKRKEATGYSGLRVDGQFVGSVLGGSQSLTAPGRIILGAQQTINNFLNGDIGEVQIYNSYLSEADEIMSERNLMSKWGVLPLNASPTNFAYNPTGSGYPTPTASYTSSGDSPWNAVDGTVAYYLTPIRNRWTCYGSGNSSDWLQINFGSPKQFNQVVLDIYSDNGGVRANPYVVQYSTNGTTWTNTSNTAYPTEVGNEPNDVTFTPVTAQYVRVLFTNSTQYSGVTEMQVF